MDKVKSSPTRFRPLELLPSTATSRSNSVDSLTSSLASFGSLDYVPSPPPSPVWISPVLPPIDLPSDDFFQATLDALQTHPLSSSSDSIQSTLSMRSGQTIGISPVSDNQEDYHIHYIHSSKPSPKPSPEPLEILSVPPKLQLSDAISTDSLPSASDSFSDLPLPRTNSDAHSIQSQGSGRASPALKQPAARWAYARNNGNLLKQPPLDLPALYDSQQVISTGFQQQLEPFRQSIKMDSKEQTQFANYLLSAMDLCLNENSDKHKATAKDLAGEAFKTLKKQCTQQLSHIGKPPNPEAQYLLATIYTNGLPMIDQQPDPDRAFALFVQASKQQHSLATYRAAVCYELGLGTKRDYSRAAGFYRKACAQGETSAMHRWGRHLVLGTCGQVANPREGVNWLKRAASQADAGLEGTLMALWDLAMLHEGKMPDGSLWNNSIDIILDQSYAYSLYVRAAQLNHAPSQHRLGQAHEKGELGVDVNAQRSLAWYTMAAEQGNAESQLALSSTYLKGVDGILNQSDKDAFLWALKAAKRGLPKAEWAVGCFYEKGFGCDASSDLEREWTMKAASHGHKKAQQKCLDQGWKIELASPKPKTRWNA